MQPQTAQTCSKMIPSLLNPSIFFPKDWHSSKINFRNIGRAIYQNKSCCKIKIVHNPRISHFYFNQLMLKEKAVLTELMFHPDILIIQPHEDSTQTGGCVGVCITNAKEKQMLEFAHYFLMKSDSPIFPLLLSVFVDRCSTFFL